MTRVGARLADCLAPGDAVLLIGPIGAGKSHLARAMIRAHLGGQDDIPSPTYTLVQTYETAGADIWHADLYRLGDSSELVELGLDDAFETAIVVIEWADRLPAELVPTDAIRIDIQPKDDGRIVAVTATEKQADTLKSVFDHGG